MAFALVSEPIASGVGLRDPHIGFAGHGIGLTSAKRIAERHSGSLQLESKEGLGTTFYVTLPAAKKADSIQKFGSMSL